MTKPYLVVRTAEGLEGGNLAQFLLQRAVETSLSQPEKRRGLMGGKKGDGKAGKLLWYQEGASREAIFKS